jgi:hypothetical protein
LQCDLRRLCSQMLPPPHSLQYTFCRPCGHFFCLYILGGGFGNPFASSTDNLLACFFGCLLAFGKDALSSRERFGAFWLRAAKGMPARTQMGPAISTGSAELLASRRACALARSSAVYRGFESSLKVKTVLFTAPETFSAVEYLELGMGCRALWPRMLVDQRNT